MKINIAGISVEVRKKAIKNLHLYVKAPDGRVVLSAPLIMSDMAIERFITMKIDWIKHHINRFAGQLQQSKQKYLSGEEFYVWGRKYRIELQCGNKNSLVLAENNVTLTVRKESTLVQREKFIREWYRAILKTEVERLLLKWEKITGLRVNSWQTKYMITRWGTCNPKAKKIWFNVQLARKPLQCLECVILHELMHFIEKRHNAHFMSLMDKFMPNWREVMATLNNQKVGLI